VNEVVRPSRLASSRSAWNCSSVAPVTARTARIRSSKPANTRVETAKPAASPVPMPTRRAPIRRTEVPKALSRFCARLSPRTSLLSLAYSSM